VYVIKLSGLHCTGNLCVTQRKGPEEELLSVLLGASRWQVSDNPLLRVGVPPQKLLLHNKLKVTRVIFAGGHR